MSASLAAVSFYFDTAFEELTGIADKKDIVIITDENVSALHPQKFSGIKCIIIPAGEKHKNQQTVDHIIYELINLDANKNTLLVGVGGGVVTDIAGYVASIFMRGISFGLVPTSILCMVDAAIGGKNGVDVGDFKNLVGSIRQPEFILYDYDFLRTLPFEEWVNGFAEVIKHACINDAPMFAKLERYSLRDLQADPGLLSELIEENVVIKASIVAADEFEKGDRKLLNFGHTIGHAIENLYGLPHGHAISIGMVAACNLSERFSGLHFEESKRIKQLLSNYHLPVDIDADHEKVFKGIRMDKKRSGDNISFILLESIGKGKVFSIPLTTLKEKLKEIV